MPPFGCDRMTTDKGGLMESRVWFWGAFSVKDVHWQKGVEMSGRDGKKAVPVLKVHDGAALTRLHLESILPAFLHTAFPHHNKHRHFIQQVFHKVRHSEKR